MAQVLESLGVDGHFTGNLDLLPPGCEFPEIGFVRVQWGGPWVDCAAPELRYRKSHWIVVVNKDPNNRRVFDVNGCGWGSFHQWESILVPWLIDRMLPDHDGTWWPTHAVEFRL
jgi:hypothetical protein